MIILPPGLLTYCVLGIRLYLLVVIGGVRLASIRFGGVRLDVEVERLFLPRFAMLAICRIRVKLMDMSESELDDSCATTVDTDVAAAQTEGSTELAAAVAEQTSVSTELEAAATVERPTELAVAAGWTSECITCKDGSLSRTGQVMCDSPLETTMSQPW